eukprot:6182159-Pleurochrysis_carterae.AAC.7
MDVGLPRANGLGGANNANSVNGVNSANGVNGAKGMRANGVVENGANGMSANGVGVEANGVNGVKVNGVKAFHVEAVRYGVNVVPDGIRTHAPDDAPHLAASSVGGAGHNGVRNGAVARERVSPPLAPSPSLVGEASAVASGSVGQPAPLAMNDDQ